MSRKHYREIASAIADAVDTASTPAAKQSIESLARNIAVLLKQDNPRFDYQRFYFAAGLNEQGRIDAD